MVWVTWRGRRWWFAGGAEEGGAEGPDDPAAALAAARARIVELEEVLGAERTASGEAAARLGELEAAASASAAELEQARQQAGEAERRALEAHRRALLAEHRGQVVEELVQGTTVEELERSVETARAAYGRVADLVRRDLAGRQVPAGAGPRREDGGEGLSALQKIARGLGR